MPKCYRTCLWLTRVGMRLNSIFPWFLRTVIIIIKLLYMSSEANASLLDVSALIAW